MANIVQIAKRIDRAADMGREVRLASDELDLLIGIGLVDIVNAAKAKYLKEQARCRNLSSIKEVHTSSGETGNGTGPSEALSSPSSGTIGTRDANEALQRALTMSGKGARRSTGNTLPARKGSKSAQPVVSIAPERRISS